MNRLSIHNGGRLIRAATFGRGVWERPIADAFINNADIYLRDNGLDIGRPPTFDPATGEGLFTGADLKLDAGSTFFGTFTSPTSTVDYTAAGKIDYIGFRDFPNGQPRHGNDARLYLQVNNRGPTPATNVQARLFWANKEGDAFPDLTSEFWDQFPEGDLLDTPEWRAIGPAQTISELAPGEPSVLTFSWPSEDIGDRIGVLAAVTSPDDPIDEVRLNTAEVVATNKRALLKEMTADRNVRRLVGLVIAAVGLVSITAIALD